MALTLAELKAKSKPTIERVTISCGELCVSTITVAQRCEVENAILASDKHDANRTRRALLRAALVNEDGTPFVTCDAELDDVMNCQAPDIEVAFEAALRLNKITKKDQDTLEKN